MRELLPIAEDDFEIQEPLPKDMFEVVSDKKYCNYHKFNFHTTNECIQLRDILERLARQGELHQYINLQFFKDHSKTYIDRKPKKNFPCKQKIAEDQSRTFLTLSSFFKLKSKLKRMFLGNRYNNLKISKIAEGKKVATIVISDERFWTDLELAIGIFIPLVKLLRLVDGEKRPAIGFLYSGLLDAKNELIEGLRNNIELCIMVVNAIDHYVDGKLDSELHLMAYYLNPYYFYRNQSRIVGSEKIIGGVLKCIERFYSSEEIQDKITREEMRAYCEASGTFGNPGAKRQREKLDDDFNPAHWWNVWGAKAPYLQGIATKILNLTCSSSGCERNWSAFEWTQSKKRNKLDIQRLNDIIFVQFNSRMKKKGDPVKKPDPILEICEDGEISNSKEWFERESSSSGNDEGMEAFGFASEISNMISTSGAKKSCNGGSNKSSQVGKKSSDSSSVRSVKSALPLTNESDNQIVASNQEFIGSDESEIEESEGDIVLDDSE